MRKLEPEPEKKPRPPTREPKPEPDRKPYWDPVEDGPQSD